jgi:hypothetical protein
VQCREVRRVQSAGGLYFTLRGDVIAGVDDNYDAAVPRQPTWVAPVRMAPGPVYVCYLLDYPFLDRASYRELRLNHGPRRNTETEAPLSGI